MGLRVSSSHLKMRPLHCADLTSLSPLPPNPPIRPLQEPFLLEEIGADFFLRVQLKTRKASAHPRAACCRLPSHVLPFTVCISFTASPFTQRQTASVPVPSPLAPSRRHPPRQYPPVADRPARSTKPPAMR
jgi:hypothetical protein